jgi:predicted transcriptional regulator
VQDLAEETGMEIHTVRKWLQVEGLKPIRERTLGKRKVPYYDKAAALKVILPHKGKPKNKDAAAGVDPETGLSWHQAKLREEARKLRRANTRAEKLESEELMLTVDHQAILAAVISRIEQVPGKAQSEIGLTGGQVVQLRRMLDEARESAAKEIENHG